MLSVVNNPSGRLYILAAVLFLGCFVMMIMPVGKISLNKGYPNKIQKLEDVKVQANNVVLQGNKLPETTSAVVPVEDKKPQVGTSGGIFYGIFTEKSRSEYRTAIKESWGSHIREKDLHWYADEDLGEGYVTNKIVGTFKEEFHKMLEFWKLVYRDYGSMNYSWFVRFWDDSYVFVDNLDKFLNQEMLSMYSDSKNLKSLYSNSLYDMFNWKELPNFDKPVVVGQITTYKGSKISIPGIGGHSGWALNSKALKLIAENDKFCLKLMSDDSNIKCKDSCEDIMIGECLRALEIQFVPMCGGFSHPPWSQYSCRISDSELHSHAEVAARSCNDGYPIGTCPVDRYNPVSFHLMSPKAQKKVETLWYSKKSLVDIAFEYGGGNPG